ncbi:MAG: tetratricopeptide repeat protein [Myxococcales bacterium]
MKKLSPQASLLLSLALSSGCAARTAQPTTPNKVVEMEALRIVAKHDEAGNYSFESYDAEELFQRANSELDAGRCQSAVPLYDRITGEFASSQYASAAYYNAGLCLAQLGDKAGALAHFEALIAALPGSPDVKHATFQAGHLRTDMGEWEQALSLSDSLLARADLDGAERVEAMAMRSQALLGRNDLEAAERQAQQTLTYYRTHPEDLATDPYYAAAANFVVAETIRLRAEAMAFPDTNQDEQRAVLVKRAQMLLDAQREYFNAVRFTNAHWAAASGNRIGAMYDKLWHDLMGAPVPKTLSEPAKAVYPQELAKLIKPLLRHAIRYWELTLMMVERTGVQTEWAEATRKDLERTRTLLLEQPPGLGGLPAEVAKPAVSSPAPEPASAPSPSSAPATVPATSPGTSNDPASMRTSGAP